MASRTIALTVLAQEYANELVRTVNRTCVALRVLPIRVGGGSNCAWVIKGDGATAAVMAEGAAAGTPANDPHTAATLNWAYYKADGGATGPQQATAATASSPTGNMESLANDINDSISKICSVVNGHIYTGDPTASPVEVGGFDYAIMSTTNTYAGINRTSNAAARPTVINPGVATPLSITQVRKDVADVKVACGEAPDLAFCHPDVMNEVYALFDANRQYVQPVTSVTTRRGNIELDGSVNAVRISGCTFIEDKDASRESGNTSGRIYYVNSNYVDVMALPSKEITGLLAELGIAPGAMLRGNDGFGEVPLLTTVQEIAKAGDADLFMAKTYLQMRVRSPKHCGVRRFVQING